MQAPQSKATSVVAVVASAVYGTIVATGALAIGFVITATAKGYTALEFYAAIFPSYRGQSFSEISPVVYVVFFLYVLIAVEIAVASRRRFAKRMQ